MTDFSEYLLEDIDSLEVERFIASARLMGIKKSSLDGEKKEYKELACFSLGTAGKIDRFVRNYKTFKEGSEPSEEETKDRFFATRKPLDTSFNKKKIEESVTDTGVQKILLRHLETKENNPELAFSLDGIDEMNQNIVHLNGGKYHQPILKVRVYEKADKFAIGQKGNKSSKFVEAAKGTNLYFAVYETETLNEETGKVVKKRSYATVPLNVVMERLKQGLSPAPANEQGYEPKFVLSPNDLVYVPAGDEIISEINEESINYNRLYKMVSSSGNQCFFVKTIVANSIVDKYEFSSLNKMERAITGEMIKEICVPVKIDRLGNIKKIGY